MNREERGNLTVGDPGKKLLGFALPIILINFLQAVYSVANMVILGHFAGEDCACGNTEEMQWFGGRIQNP